MGDLGDLSSVRGILKTAGLRVEAVPEANSKRCDLRAEDDQEQYLIEVKRFDDDEAVSNAQRGGNAYCRSRSRFSSNTVADAVAEAVEQLAVTAREGGDDLRIVALIANSNYGAEVTNILGTLYGIRKVAGQKEGTDLAWDSLYFSHSAFFRYRHALDGALVLDGTRAELFLNDYGERLGRLGRCGLARFFQEKRALRDKASFERQGFLVADCDADRNDENAVLRHLEQKYKLKKAVCLHSFDLRGVVFLPRPR